VAVADLIISRVGNVGVQTNRRVQYANFSVLRETRAPATLLELGFISNAGDNDLFDERFDAYANAIASGIMSSLGVQCQPPVTPEPPVVTPTPPTTPPIVPTPPAGDYTANVRAIQTRLNTQYGQNLVVDGIWGPLSYRALVRAYQMELNRQFNAGLVVDGIWGPRTRSATRLVRQGQSGNLVWLLQAGLYVNGFPTALDGIFGPNTEAQVRAFQRANGLGVDGIAGPNTFERLFARA